MGRFRSPTPKANQLQQEQPCLFTSTCWTNHHIFPTCHVMKNVRRSHPPGASFHLKEKDVSHESELCLFCIGFWLPGSVHTQISVEPRDGPVYLPSPGVRGSWNDVWRQDRERFAIPALPSASPAWLLKTQQEAGQHAPLTSDTLQSAAGHPSYLDTVLTALSPALPSSRGP